MLEILNLFNDTPDTFLLQSLWFCASGSNCLCVFVLLETVPGGSGIVGIGIVLLEHVMLVTAKMRHNVKLKDLSDIPHSQYSES